MQGTVDYHTIATLGNASNFGNFSGSRETSNKGPSAVSDGSIGIICTSQSWNTDLFIDYWTISTPGNSTKFGTFATPGNALDFGRVAHDVEYGAGVSNGTRAVIGGGNGGQMEYFNMDTATGTAVISENFGTMTFGSHPSSRLWPAGYAGD